MYGKGGGEVDGERMLRERLRERGGGKVEKGVWGGEEEGRGWVDGGEMRGSGVVERVGEW